MASASIPMPIRSWEAKRSRASSRVIMLKDHDTRGAAGEDFAGDEQVGAGGVSGLEEVAGFLSRGYAPALPRSRRSHVGCGLGVASVSEEFFYRRLSRKGRRAR